jgi:hypothetical protein
MSTNLNTARYIPATEKCNVTAEKRISSTGDLQCRNPQAKSPTTVQLISLQSATAQHYGAVPADAAHAVQKEYGKRVGKHTCYADQPVWYLSYPKRSWYG